MTQPHILKLAQQGDVDAIATLLNDALAGQGTIRAVDLQQGCLYVSLLASQLEKTDAIAQIQRTVLTLQNPDITTLKLDGQIWQEAIDLRVPDPITATHILPGQAVTRSAPQVTQMVAGNYNIQVSASHGSEVNIALPEQRPQIQPRRTPVLILPQPFFQLLGRKEEISLAIATLSAQQSVEFYSQPGLGKTVLLCHLAHYPQVTAPFTDGAILLPEMYPAVADLLQFLFDAFYESDRAYKPTDAYLRYVLQGKQSLILLDDPQWHAKDIETLLKALPGCTLLLASPERRLEVGRSRGLAGLAPSEALVLVERELGRSLTPVEHTSAESLCQLLQGNPRQIMQAVGRVQAEGYSLTEVVRQLQQSTTPPGRSLLQQILATLQEHQRYILAALAALGSVALLARQAAALTHLPEVEPMLIALQQRSLIQGNGLHYHLDADLRETLEQTWDLTPWREQALTYFIDRAEQLQSTPTLLFEDINAIAHLMQWATESNRWAEALRLVKASESAIALSKRWGLWEQMLQWGLQAARSLGDLATEAWTLHQLGTRALCLDDLAVAQEMLQQALKIRESLSDELGAAVTRHNLSFLPAVFLPNQPEAVPAAIASRLLPLWLQGLLLVLLLFGAGVGVRLLGARSPNPAEPEPSISPVLPSQPLLPGLAVEPNSLNFGQQAVKTDSAEQSIKITNTSSALLQIRQVELSGKHRRDFALVTDTCSATFVEPGNQCSVSIRFTPRATGKRQAQLQFAHNAASKKQAIALLGEGTKPNAENRSPKPKDDEAQTEFNRAITVNVLENDPDAKQLKLTNVSEPENGTAQLEDRSITYQPNDGFVGTDSFQYTVRDRQGSTATATVRVTVEASSAPANNPPNASNDEFNTGHNTAQTFNVLENDRDPDDDTFSLIEVAQPQQGSVEFEPDGTVTYQPKEDFSGRDSFTYTIRDSNNSTASATVTVTVAANQPPTAQDDRTTLTYEPGVNGLEAAILNVLENDRDPDGSEIKLIEVSSAQFGTVQINDDRTLTYQAHPGFFGPQDSFTYTIADEHQATATATVTITIEARSQPDPSNETSSGPF